MNKGTIFSFLIISLCCLVSCVGDLQVDGPDGSYAIPLVDTEINLIEIAENTSPDIAVSVSADDRVTLSYFGEVIQQTALEIYPPVPIGQDLPIIGNEGEIPLPVEAGELLTITKAEFDLTRIKLKYTSTVEEDVNVVFTFPEITKNGEAFTFETDLVYFGISPFEFETDFIDLTGWVLETDSNQLLFEYQATTESGEEVVFETASLFIDFLKFSYIEGFFGERIFEIGGSIITVGVFNKWLSGGFIFEDPTIRFLVQNSFGLPVKSRVNFINISTLSGDTFDLEAAQLEEGLEFDFPNFNEIGEIKETAFVFDKSNSNLSEIFNEKAVAVNYDVDALINFDLDEPFIGYATDSSFYKVELAVDVPLFLRFNDLVLTDTLEVDFADLSDFNEARFKFISQNAFPFNVDLQVGFIDSVNNETLVLFDGDGLTLPSAELFEDGTTQALPAKTDLVDLDNEQMQHILKSKKMALVAKFTNSEIANDQNFWILSDYGVDFKIGAIISNE